MTIQQWEFRSTHAILRGGGGFECNLCNFDLCSVLVCFMIDLVSMFNSSIQMLEHDIQSSEK